MSRDACTVPVEARGERLDRYLARILDTPRNQIQRWIRDGLVQLDGNPTLRPSHVLEGGERLLCEPPPAPEIGRVRPEAGDVPLLHEDEALVVVNKPAGLTVHPGAGRAGGTLANFLLERYPEMLAAGSPDRPGIVHRLDAGTSGVMVVARTPEAHRALSRAFARREVDKSYLAIVYGNPDQDRGTIDAPIGRHPQDRKRMTIRDDGRPAHSDWTVLARAPGVSLLRVDLHTGRTHQIRVHLKSVHLPLVGDPVYGEERWRSLRSDLRGALRDFPRPALHAWRLAFRHPSTGEWSEFTAPLPPDLSELWRQVAGEAPPL